MSARQRRWHFGGPVLERDLSEDADVAVMQRHFTANQHCYVTSLTRQHYLVVLLTLDSLQFLFSPIVHNMHFSEVTPNGEKDKQNEILRRSFSSFFVTGSHHMLSAMDKTSITIIPTYHAHVTPTHDSLQMSL